MAEYGSWHNNVAEQAVCGSMLLDRKAFDKAREKISRDRSPFYTAYHAELFQAIIAAPTNDPITVAQHIMNSGLDQRLPEKNGTYLQTCMAAVTTPSNVEHYINIVNALAYRRRMYEGLTRARQIIDDDGSGPGQLSTLLAELLGAEAENLTGQHSRKVDLTAYLDGTHKDPVSSVGLTRIDGLHLLYAARWHTLIALNEAGKSWQAVGHCVEEMRKGNNVVYAHFEEPSPTGTVGRLRDMAVPDDLILKHFVWLDCSTRWTPGQFAAELAHAIDR